MEAGATDMGWVCFGLNWLGIGAGRGHDERHWLFLVSVGRIRGRNTETQVGAT